MMKVTRTTAMVAFATVCALHAGWSQAQTLQEPAEIPPSSFSGTQFVDSSGCVFIRAGVSGNVRWVPRVTRDRRQVCGFEPTFAQPRAASSATPDAVAVIGSDAQIAANKTPDSGAKAKAAPAASVQPQPKQAKRMVVSGTTTKKPSQARFLPQHLVEKRAAEARVKVPSGYRQAWQDDRLNLKRAEQTAEGSARMHSLWTETVPMRERK